MMRKSKQELIKDRVHDEWYIRTSDDDDDLEYLEDYLEITSSGGFVDTMEEYYRDGEVQGRWLDEGRGAREGNGEFRWIRGGVARLSEL
ncbi:hypothetical protein Tco_1576205 [Tanacetum coccineum]